jgi:DNA-binding CsgD family transcriptional regulator
MQGIALPLTSRRGEHFVLHTLPLAPSSRPKSGLPATPKAAVFICPVAQYTVTLPEVIRAALGLTAAELRVMLAIADIGGVPEVANELGLAVSTVKTHLGRVYGKTGLSRQADLVKLVSGFSTPLAGPPRIPQGDKLA